MAQQGVLNNLSGIVWARGYMFGTRAGGAGDAIQFGSLKDIKLSHTFTFAEEKGPETLSANGVGATDENLSGTYSCGVIHPEQYFTMLGGELDYNVSQALRTTYTKRVNEEPKTFNLHYVSDDQASPDLDCFVYNCLSTNMEVLSATSRAWMLNSGGFKAYGQPGGILFTMSKPGDLTNAS